jgi:hypothetical protein
MNDIEELKVEFEQKEMEYVQFSEVFNQLRLIIEDDTIDPDKIVSYLENLIEDNTKLLEENKDLNVRMEELIASQALKSELLNEQVENTYQILESVL